MILDVVYNHLGPDGAYLSTFSSQNFTTRDPSPWGAGVNLDGDGSEQVRAFFNDNALHWIHEYHVDGLRLDGTHALVDDSDTHFLAELAERVRARPFGDRFHHAIDLAACRAAAALLLLAPETPLLFMGQEWAATSPFQFFTDHNPELGAKITDGRRREFADFSEFADPGARSRIPDPQALETFEASRLMCEEMSVAPHAGILRLYRALLALRREIRRSSASAGVAVSAVDNRTVAIARGAHLVLVRLTGAGPVSLETFAAGHAGYAVVLTTEDGAFGGDGCVPQPVDNGRTIEFGGPAAIVLQRTRGKSEVRS